MVEESSQDEEDNDFVESSMMSQSPLKNETPKCTVCGQVKVKITCNYKFYNRCKKNKN